MTPIAASPHGRRWAALLMWSLVLALLANTLVYAHVVANPMLMADNWLFADTFLVHTIGGQGDIGDFLVKRAGLDHGLPHYKLLMLLNAWWFGLDFSLESVAGAVFAFLGWLVLYRMATSDVPSADRTPAFQLAMVAMAAVQLSLNAYYTYLYSMVSLGFLDYLLAFLMFSSAWQALQGRRLWPFAAWALLYAVSADTSATLAGIALSMALVVAGWQQRRWRRALLLIGITVAALVLARMVYATFGEIRGSTLEAFNRPLEERVTALLAQGSEAWRWVISPAASGVAWRNALKNYFGADWQPAQVVLGLAVVAGHAWFWWSMLRHRLRASSFGALCLMLLFYGYLAGVLYGRVFVRGAAYFDQGRYVSLYQIGILALLLMAAARSAGAPRERLVNRGVALASALLVLVQVPLSLFSWSAVPDIRGYYRTMAMQYGEVVRDPMPDRDCVDQLTICGLPQDLRLRVIDTLHRHRLNMFSERFARAHPELVRAAGPLTPPTIVPIPLSVPATTQPGMEPLPAR